MSNSNYFLYWKQTKNSTANLKSPMFLNHNSLSYFKVGIRLLSNLWIMPAYLFHQAVMSTFWKPIKHGCVCMVTIFESINGKCKGYLITKEEVTLLQLQWLV